MVADVTQPGYAFAGGAEAVVTWNQRDLARDRVRDVVARYCEELGVATMRVGTPEEVALWLGVRVRT